MARLLLLSIKDNDAAEAIIKSILAADDIHKEGWGDHVAELGTLISAYSQVEWVIARPLASCKCTTDRKSDKGWSKTKRFGWWVHTKCNRCSSMVVHNFVRNLMNGNHDLLHEYKTPEPVDVHVISSNEHIMAGPPASENHQPM